MVDEVDTRRRREAHFHPEGSETPARWHALVLGLLVGHGVGEG
jgi:hypothetical protein